MGNTPFMRRSRHVVAPLLASAAVALLTACKQTEMERCVDEQNHVVDPKFCQNPQTPLYNTGGGTTVIYPYHLYYGGSGGYGFGSLATGGSNTPIAGHSYSTSSGTTRGGFGGFFSGGGEGGGHGGGAGE